MLLNKSAARWNIFAHQHRKHMVGSDHIRQRHLNQGPDFADPSSFPTVGRRSSRQDLYSAGFRSLCAHWHARNQSLLLKYGTGVNFIALFQDIDQRTVGN